MRTARTSVTAVVCRITPHALSAWAVRSARLGLDGSEAALRLALGRARPEHVGTNWHLLKRHILKGGQYFRHSGWRFVVEDGTVVTVERVRPHENLHKVRIDRKRKHRGLG